MVNTSLFVNKPASTNIVQCQEMDSNEINTEEIPWAIVSNYAMQGTIPETANDHQYLGVTTADNLS